MILVKMQKKENNAKLTIDYQSYNIMPMMWAYHGRDNRLVMRFVPLSGQHASLHGLQLVLISFYK